MSDAASAAPPSREYLLRKLHSLTGLLPVGVFLLEHYYSNLKALGPAGEARFNELVRDLQQNPLTIYAEVGLIAVPLLFHALYGLVIAWQGRPNNAAQPYLRNWTYTLQRITGVILLLYVGYHVYHTRLMPHVSPQDAAWQMDGGQRMVSYAYMRRYMNSVHLGIPVVSLYVIGVVAAAFHLANGLWNMGVHWGLTVGPRAQRMSAVACSLFGLVLLGVGLLALSAFANPAAVLARL